MIIPTNEARTKSMKMKNTANQNIQTDIQFFSKMANLIVAFGLVCLFASIFALVESVSDNLPVEFIARVATTQGDNFYAQLAFVIAVGSWNAGMLLLYLPARFDSEIGMLTRQNTKKITKKDILVVGLALLTFGITCLLPFTGGVSADGGIGVYVAFGTVLGWGLMFAVVFVTLLRQTVVGVRMAYDKFTHRRTNAS